MRYSVLIMCHENYIGVVGSIHMIVLWKARASTLSNIIKFGHRLANGSQCILLVCSGTYICREQSVWANQFGGHSTHWSSQGFRQQT